MIVIVGEAPSKSDDAPPMGPNSSTGRRIARWIGDAPGVVKINLFDEQMPQPWTPEQRAQAKVNAMKILDVAMLSRHTSRPDRFVLLGRTVAHAFGLDTAKFFEWRGEFVVIPHPSGTSRWWNESKNREQADDFWKETLRATV